MRMLISLLLLLFFAFLSAYIAKQRGRDPVAWFMIGILLGIFSPLLLMILKPLNPGQELEGETEEHETLRISSSVEESYANKEWFYLDLSRKQQGPVYFKALRLLWEEEKITSSTYVWTEGMSQWKRIRELPGFAESL